MHGNLEKPRRAVEIARREIDRMFGPAGTWTRGGSADDYGRRLRWTI